MGVSTPPGSAPLTAKTASTKLDSPLVSVLNYCLDVKTIKNYLNSFTTDFKLLLGDRKIIFATKRNSNTAALLFNKYGFAQSPISLNSQKCGSTNCSSCILKRDDISFFDIQENFTIKPSKSLNCKSENVISSCLQYM